MTDNFDLKIVYVLLDGVGDLPHPNLAGKTPLGAANTPNLDRLAKNGTMGEVITVGKGIAPESDIAVFNMLGYKFKHDDYVGRGVVEAIGIGIDFKDGDLALRGNFATLNGDGVIIDRRAGRNIEKQDAEAVSNEIEEKIKFSDENTTVTITPTIGHRLVIRIRSNGALSSNISNTDPSYGRVNGMGIARAVTDFLRIEKCLPLDEEPHTKLASKLVNELTEQSLDIMRKSKVNERRKENDKKLLNGMLLRDAGNTYPKVTPINDLHSMKFSCIVDMPVEIGISEILKMKTYDAGGLTDYEEKAKVAAKAMDEQNAVYVHLKGPDEFGHDGDARGKMENIEEIDKRFFGTLLDNIDSSKVAVVISADHSTPCVNKGHSADPVPLLISGNMVTSDDTQRFTETEAKKGRIGLIDGAQVITTGIGVIKSQK
jgi:2,3-bisphosphoglycerate-independent phosphoglycerate mutase